MKTKTQQATVEGLTSLEILELKWLVRELRHEMKRGDLIAAIAGMRRRWDLRTGKR